MSYPARPEQSRLTKTGRFGPSSDFFLISFVGHCPPQAVCVAIRSGMLFGFPSSFHPDKTRTKPGQASATHYSTATYLVRTNSLVRPYPLFGAWGFPLRKTGKNRKETGNHFATCSLSKTCAKRSE